MEGFLAGLFENGISMGAVAVLIYLAYRSLSKQIECLSKKVVHFRVEQAARDSKTELIEARMKRTEKDVDGMKRDLRELREQGAQQ